MKIGLILIHLYTSIAWKNFQTITTVSGPNIKKIYPLFLFIIILSRCAVTSYKREIKGIESKCILPVDF
jgi:hypothetical protein